MDKMTTFEKSAMFFGPAMVILFILQIPLISTLAAFVYAALATVGMMMIVFMLQNTVMGNKIERLNLASFKDTSKYPEWAQLMQDVSKIAAFFTIGLTYPFVSGILLVSMFGVVAKFILNRIPAEANSDETTIS